MKTSIHFFIISRSVLLRVRNVQTNVLEKIKTHVLCSTFFFSENHAVYEIMWKNAVQPARRRMTV